MIDFILFCLFVCFVFFYYCFDSTSGGPHQQEVSPCSSLLYSRKTFSWKMRDGMGLTKMIDICPTNPPKFTPPTKVKKTVLPWNVFRACHLLLSLTSYVPSSSFKFIPLPLPDSLSFKNLIPKIKWITPQSSLSLNRNCLFHFHPHLRRGSSQPLPSINDPTRSAFVSSENPENHLCPFSSVTVSLENLRHFLTTDSATQRRKGVIFPFYMFLFSAYFTSSFSFSSYFFAIIMSFSLIPTKNKK